MTPLEEVFRGVWPVLVASTARLVRDLDLAEDCAQEAVERALRGWPAGVPDNPRPTTTRGRRRPTRSGWCSPAATPRWPASRRWR
ncbi:hypothetical protein ACLFMI_17445 [Pseudonocardia nantongensis]|uniref:hypothetical protein n=1 Tax=Pseudonocardia nantongensis TaxID=1181885 RepID=UPI00397C6677